MSWGILKLKVPNFTSRCILTLRSQRKKDTPLSLSLFAFTLVLV